MQKKKSNIVLIGMAGAGKSTIGVELSRLLGLDFVDIDTLIEKDQQTPLQDILSDLGVQGFRQLEERLICSMAQQNHVIATGGSAIYSEAGMQHLKRSSVFVLLDVSLPVLQQRVADYSSRGLVKNEHQSFAQLFAERLPLYQKHADVVISCTEQSVSATCQSIRKRVEDSSYHF